MDKNTNLNDWLSYIEQAHVKDIDMGLSRTAEMINRLNIDFTGQKVITVGGTNGKGTTCALIESICLKAGLTVGVYSSPHLVSFCERIRINGKQIDEASLCATFSKIDAARHTQAAVEVHATELPIEGSIALTYFEFATLAGLSLFAEHRVDVVILEVGLGGRLDATNVVDADIAVITSIGLDHQDWLGDTKEKIGFEKAGIFRANRPAVIGEPNPPRSMLKYANSIDAKTHCVGTDFLYSEVDQTAEVVGNAFNLSQAKIPKPNVATALAAIAELSILLCESYPFIISAASVQQCIEQTQVLGRHTQWKQGEFRPVQKSLPSNPCTILLDVAHNEDSAQQLYAMLASHRFDKCHIVAGMLKDKNIEVSLAAFASVDAHWYCSSLPSERGEAATRLVESVKAFNSKATKSIQAFDEVEEAFEASLLQATKNDLILVFGSFLTVAAVIEMNASA